MEDCYKGFVDGVWSREINVRDFIQKNYTPYDGDDSFLAGPTEATRKLWDQVMELSRQEREAGGVLDMDTRVISTITSHGAGYLNKDLEKIVGFQTDKPFKRSLQPYGESAWRRKRVRKTGTKWIRKSSNSLPFTAKRTTPACLTPIPRKCGPAAPAISLPVCRMPMAADGLWATIAGWRCMAWTG